MVFLPEACDYICEKFTDVAKNAEPENGFVITKFKDLARQYDVWLSLGGIHVKVKEIMAIDLVLSQVKPNHLSML